MYKYPTFSSPVTLHTHLPVKMEQTISSETLEFDEQPRRKHTTKKFVRCVVIGLFYGTAGIVVTSNDVL
jgi:hypothetical protein